MVESGRTHDPSKGEVGSLGDPERGGFVYWWLWVRWLPGWPVTPSGTRLLVGEAILGPGHHDRGREENGRVRFCGAWPGEDYRPCFCREYSISKSVAKVWISAGRHVAQALFEGR